MTTDIQTLEVRIAQLEKQEILLRRTIAIQQEQIKRGGFSDENRRLRAKIAEWEGTSDMMNGGYYHGSRFIRPFIDNIDV